MLHCEKSRETIMFSFIMILSDILYVISNPGVFVINKVRWKVIKVQ